MVDGLEQEGLVARRPSAEDGRGAVVVLTARGAQRLRDMAPEHFARLGKWSTSSLSTSVRFFGSALAGRSRYRCADCGVVGWDSSIRVAIRIVVNSRQGLLFSYPNS
ncbi:MarR family winged helix-turn-helix transcriptional regulator [Rhodococcus sp. 3Y1]